MKKRSLLIIIVLVLMFSLFGCSSADDMGREDNSNDNGGVVLGDDGPVSINRKIIYTVDTSINTKDITAAVTSLKANLREDEWIDLETHSSGYSRMVFRVKSARIDEFIGIFDNIGTVYNFTKEAEDVSLKYQNYENKITALETEYDRLLDILASASLSDVIYINKRLTEIELEIQTLSGALTQFDSLIDYSKVTVQIYERKVLVSPSFGSKMGSALENGWDAVTSLLKFFVLAFMTILPFSIIIVPVGAIVFFSIRHKRKKNIKKHEE